ncbi:MAG: PadR family transcriptional regulator [Thermoplasmatales archaeon]|nr:PadR family transcriptional regulator [Thermoplasmatales archaeon]
MASILSFLDKAGKSRGFLTLYLLNSLKEKPKSGYDILMEIKEKTRGAWMPSKGTIYPLLKHLKKEGFIAVKTTGQRSKSIFEITLEGEKELIVMSKEGRKIHGKMMQFRDLISSIFAEGQGDVANLFFEIRDLLLDMRDISSELQAEKKDELIKILERCLSDLKRVVPMDKLKGGKEI